MEDKYEVTVTDKRKADLISSICTVNILSCGLQKFRLGFEVFRRV